MIQMAAGDTNVGSRPCRNEHPVSWYLERAAAALRQFEDVPDSLLAHLSPLGWEHVNLTGTMSGALNTSRRKILTD